MADPPVLLLGMDLGGTHFRSSVVQEHGTVLWRVQERVRFPRDPRKVLKEVHAVLEEALAASGEWGPVTAVGVGAAGPLDAAGGVLFEPPNLAGLARCDLTARLSGRFGLPVYLENDANAAAYGEFVCGAGSGADSLLTLTLGTGVGGGIVLGGRIHHGATGLAGEFGHTLAVPGGLSCPCGACGCLEQYASARATRNRWQAWVEEKTHPPPRGCPESLADVDTAALARFADEGDSGALETFRITGTYLGDAIASLVNTLDPERVVLSGGMAGALRHIRPSLDLAFKARALPPARDQVTIVPGRLGGDAGLIGAALAALYKHRESK